LLLPSTLLIANRGEIACRIMRTCRRLGVRTVAVFSDADEDALHVRSADAAIRIGPGPAAESYLLIDAVLAAALRTGAKAIHPGYGFLAENAGFARAVRDRGLVFVGPSPEAMERLGDKDSAKALAAAAGVPTIPGYLGADQDPQLLAAEAARIGFPLLIKAVAGGGGRGMRRVDGAHGFADALAACKREAMGAFGRDAVLLERLIERPRHIEVQVLGDAQGGAIHLLERDCTLQRRHQKVIEEAPAAGLGEGVREALGGAAVRLARAAGYANAGTVEFLVEPDGTFWFIEMNTRIQVEHPVTEAVTGLDLIELQLRIAMGGPLPLRQDEIVARGHAIEARLCAEDPARGWLPSTGRLARFRLPPAGGGLRIEAGAVEGDSVSPFYDSMIAKLVAHGPDRRTAIDRLAAALAAIEVEGPATNLPLLEAVLAGAPFRQQTIDTTWLDRAAPTLEPPPPDAVDSALAAIAVLAELDRATGPSPWDRLDGWRLNAPPCRVVRFASPALTVVALGTAAGLTLAAQRRTIAARDGQDERGLWAELDGTILRAAAYRSGAALVLSRAGRRLRLLLDDPTRQASGEVAGGGTVRASMPGRIAAVLVEPGQPVTVGQKLLVLEAMKMEHALEAPIAGKVTVVRATTGEQVDEGSLLVEIEPTPP